jgi:RNA recognition motif-containing protein
VLISNIPKSVKESEFALKLADICGKTSFDYLLEYTPKQPCYLDLARTSDPLTNWWFVAEFENPNALKQCVDHIDGLIYKDSKLRVRVLSSKEYDDTCGLLGIMKARTKRFKKSLKGKRLSIVLASNVSSRVTSDALYKFFSFPGDPIEVTIDRSRKIALIAYDTEEQAVIAIACDQAVLGPAMIRIELYRPEKHGKDLLPLLKVGQTGDLTHTGAQTGYIQISERNASAAPESPAIPSRSGAAPPLYDPSRPSLPLGGGQSSPRSLSGYPNLLNAAAAAPPNTPTSIVTNFGTPMQQQHYGVASSSQAPKVYPPVSAGYPSASSSSHNGNPYAQPSSSSSSSSSHGPSHPAPQQHRAPAQGTQAIGTPQKPEDWSKLVPSAKYTVTTEYK